MSIRNKKGEKKMEQLDKMFGVTEAGSDVATELRAGGATFLTMAYILLVNPSMLAATGIPFNDALFATSIACLLYTSPSPRDP